MSSQEVTAELDHERGREENQQSSVTENEEEFKGPKFYPPVYRRRYAAVCELVKRHQAKKVLIYIFTCGMCVLPNILCSLFSGARRIEMAGGRGWQRSGSQGLSSPALLLPYPFIGDQGFNNNFLLSWKSWFMCQSRSVPFSWTGFPKCPSPISLLSRH